MLLISRPLLAYGFMNWKNERSLIEEATMASNDVTVPPNVNVPGPTATYDTVTINSGGSLVFNEQTTVTIQTLVKN